MPLLRTVTPPPLSLLGLAAALASCSGLPGSRPAATTEARDVAMLQLVEAAATLDRVAPPEEGSPDPDEDVYMLTTLCTLRVINTRAVPVLVQSLYGSPFDDLQLIIQDENGRRLATTSHVILQEPSIQFEYHELPEGVSLIQLICLTPVARTAPVNGVPFIPSDLLTAGLKLHFEGGFPGSDLQGKIRSNVVDVTIIDRTGGVPETGLPADPLRQARSRPW